MKPAVFEKPFSITLYLITIEKTGMDDRMATGGNNMADDRRRAHARAARAVPLKLVIVTKGGGKAMDAACKEWSDKISRYTAFSETAVKTNPKNAK